ncbi:TPM domain-containing protein, partial [Enterococcus gallinarum]
MIQQSLKNTQLADHFVQEYMKYNKNLKIFGQELAKGHDTLRTYETQLQRQLNEQLRDSDLTGDILPENPYLITHYKKEIHQLAEEE